MFERRSANVLLVQPSFSRNTFWNYHETCAAAGTRYSAAPLGLITVAALLPAAWSVRLVDCNVEPLRDADLDWADLVMIGGMLPQQRDAMRVMARAQARGRPVVIGGPDVTSSPDVYAAAEFRVLGEAEGILAEFIAAWSGGVKRGVFTAPAFPDMKTSPSPRFDLLKFEHYLHVGVQFSRGCPFNCEFCNVIELNGRVPRFKTPEQMLGELEALHALGYRGHVDFVDDNLIGNPGAARPFLAALGRWNAQRGRPFEFSSEASLNLADSDELLTLMREAGFFAVFVGIETPDTQALLDARKLQNARRDIVASVRRIHRAGIAVNAGFILGFDAETGAMGQIMTDFIEDLAVPVCMVGLLYALPETQLSRRLLREGRLHPGSDRLLEEGDADQCTSGLNFVTRRSRREILEDYREILSRIYAPAAFFGRIRRLNREIAYNRRRQPPPFRSQARDLRAFARITWQLGCRDREVRAEYWKTVAACLFLNPKALRLSLSFAALYLHLKPFSSFMDGRLRDQLAALEVLRFAPASGPCPTLKAAAQA